MAKVKVGFKGLSIAEKRAKVAKILQMCKDNPNVPNIGPYAEALREADVELGAAATKADTTRADAKIATAEQNRAEARVDRAAGRLGDDVELETEGDATKILSTGLETQSDPTPASKPTAPQNVSVSQGDYEGEIDIHHNPVAGATGYLARYCVGDSPSGAYTVWPDTFTGSVAKITGLTSGSHVWVEMCATNTAGPSPWSNAVPIYVP